MTHASELLKVQTILGHFKLGEYVKHVTPCLPEGTWNKLTRKVSDLNLLLTKKVVVDQLMKSMKDESVKSLQKIYLHLCTVDVSLHSTRRKWHAFEMREKEDELHLEQFHRKLKQGCRIKGIECDVHFEKQDEILWITLIERKVVKTRGIQVKRPIFCAHILDTTYLFCSCVLRQSLEKALLSAFSFKIIKNLSLVGKDIKSLHTILVKKEGACAALIVPRYKRKKPKRICGGIDYTQHENRMKHAEKCFPVDAKIETLTLITDDCVWCSDLVTENGDELQCRCAVRLSSRNIFMSLKKFGERNIIDPEYCSAYASRLTKEGKNKIQVSIRHGIVEEEEEEEEED